MAILPVLTIISLLLVQISCQVSTFQVTVDGAQIGVAERDQTTAAKMTPLNHPNKLPTILEADSQQKLLFKFTLKNKGQPVKAHQVFVRFTLPSSKEEIIFVAEADATNEYRFDLNLATKAKDFDFKSGSYEMSLIVGDFAISNPFEWIIGTFKLTFPAGGETKEKPSWKTISYDPKPEINHLFREPEKRPSTIVSDAFSVIVLAPFVLLLVLWWRIGVNVRNMPFSLSALLFHSGLGLIFTLFLLFWLKMDMFTTLKCLSGVALMTFLSGHSLLKTLSKSRDINEL